MERGFIVEVSNSTGFTQELCLFKVGGLPLGLSVKVINSNLDYDFLLSVAKKDGFIGAGLIVDNKDLKCVTVFDGSNFETISFDKLILQKEIFIDGVDKYISFKIPPEIEGATLIQLIP